MARHQITKNLANRVVSLYVYNDSFKQDSGEVIEYQYLELGLHKPDGSVYYKRFKGVSNDTLEIFNNLTTPISSPISVTDGDQDTRLDI